MLSLVRIFSVVLALNHTFSTPAIISLKYWWVGARSNDLAVVLWVVVALKPTRAWSSLFMPATHYALSCPSLFASKKKYKRKTRIILTSIWNPLFPWKFPFHSTFQVLARKLLLFVIFVNFIHTFNISMVILHGNSKLNSTCLTFFLFLLSSSSQSKRRTVTSI